MADKYQTVMSADLHGKNRKLLFDSIKNFSFPNNIVVDPYERMIFFVSNYAIYTSDLSGENVTMVLLEGNYPGEVGRGVRCVALDRANRKLYFSGRNFEEADTMFYLARANYDGSEVEDFNTTGVGDVYSMEVLGDTLYFAQHTEEVCHDEVLSVKTTSRERFTPRKIFVPSLCKSNMWGIKVLHPCVQRHPNDKYCSDFYI
ncbi:pro-epidermal growth factor-like [Macrosteles quadrilineatus]|uniref:pro-epidermal growth factor-like n=1 Tax=Macrosteles quadrilineatus TaxID=74068 RepID=UPI0023E20282|nr:pro-epidermal growth factor-like [Macrosteles quadrilineatus]